MKNQIIKIYIEYFLLLGAIALVVTSFMVPNTSKKHRYLLNDLRELKGKFKLEYNDKGFKEIVIISNLAYQSDHLEVHKGRIIKEELIACDFKYLWFEGIEERNHINYLMINFHYDDEQGFGSFIDEEYFYNTIDIRYLSNPLYIHKLKHMILSILFLIFVFIYNKYIIKKLENQMQSKDMS